MNWRAHLDVGESPDVITVTPLVTPDVEDGFLVADAREAQIRRYTPDGRLITHFGRRGLGPGEFVSLSGALVLSADRLIASDMKGRLTTFSTTGEVLQTDDVPLTPLYGLIRLNDSTLVLMGRSRGPAPTLLLHLWDMQTRRIRHSFFRVPEHDPELEGAYRFTGFPHAAVRGDTVAAIFALDQKIVFFDSEGAEIETRTLPIPFRDFRELRTPIPPSGSSEGFQKWVESFSVASRLHWLPDGSFLVQYFDKVGQEPQWRLLHMSREGNLLSEGPSPKLLLASSVDSLLFDAPESDEPNQWQFASLTGAEPR